MAVVWAAPKAARESMTARVGSCILVEVVWVGKEVECLLRNCWSSLG